VLSIRGPYEPESWLFGPAGCLASTHGERSDCASEGRAELPVHGVTPQAHQLSRPVASSACRDLSTCLSKQLTFPDSDDESDPVPATQDTFKKGDIAITVYNSIADVLNEAEITTPDGLIHVKSGMRLKWEIIASWLRGEPTNSPPRTVFNASQRRKVADWAGEESLGSGPLYRAGLKMIAEENGWAITSARRA
jgi:hypothetical protein